MKSKYGKVLQTVYINKSMLFFEFQKGGGFDPRTLGAPLGKTLNLRTKSWSQLIERVGLLTGKYGYLAHHR